MARRVPRSAQLFSQKSIVASMLNLARRGWMGLALVGRIDVAKPGK